MKKRLTLLLIILFVVFLLLSCGDTKTGSSKDNGTGAVSSFAATKSARNVIQKSPDDLIDGSYRQGELLVKFKDNTTRERMKQTNNLTAVIVKKDFNLVTNLQLVKLPENMTVQEGMLLYMKDTNVEYVEPNYLAQGLEIFPDDPYFKYQYGLYNDGTYKGGSAGADIDAPKAWEVSQGSRNIIVAVLDTGVDYNHPDLAGNIWSNKNEVINDGIDNDGNGYIDDNRGWDFVGNDPVHPAADNNPMDYIGHGSHVSGTIAAVGNNAQGVAGVSWKATIMPVKVLGSDLTTDIATVVSGIQYAINNGAKVINASLGWKTNSQTIYDALYTARGAGVLFVAAAGNGGSTDDIYCNGSTQNDNDSYPCYPASYDLDNIISVAASDQNDNLASFSNFGVTSVDVAAPGVDICSTITSYSSADIYDCSYSGTSMASPHVAGLAVLLMSYYTDFSYTQIKQLIETYVDKSPEPLKSMIKTGGRINAWNSLSALWAPSEVKVYDSTAGNTGITWTDRATAESGFAVYRKTAAGAYSIIAYLTQNSNIYTDVTTVGGETYTYKLVAYNSVGTSPDSSEASVVVTVPTTSSSSGGGGGCSIIGANSMTGIDILVIGMPLLYLIITRIRRLF